MALNCITRMNICGGCYRPIRPVCHCNSLLPMISAFSMINAVRSFNYSNFVPFNYFQPMPFMPFIMPQAHLFMPETFVMPTIQPQILNPNIFAQNYDIEISNNKSQYTFNSSFGNVTRRKAGTLQSQLVNKALSYDGKVNSDTEGNRLFSLGKNRHWCADFVATLVSDIYGSKLPSDFPEHLASVSFLKNWGEKHNCYVELPSSNKAKFIAENIKPGDIMIQKGVANGKKKSHTAIVVKVYEDGSFDIIEGNAGNKVKKSHRTLANTPCLKGFVSLDKFSN